MKTLQRGFWSGTLATSAMTLAFLKSFEWLDRSERSPLPPGTISTDLLKKASMENELDSQDRQALSLLAHYGYGTMFAILFCALSPASKRSGVVKGAAFGLGVWAFSYLGLLPALKVRARALNMPATRNFMMVFCHLVWGATLGYAEERFRTSGKAMFDGKLKKPRAE